MERRHQPAWGSSECTSQAKPTEVGAPLRRRPPRRSDSRVRWDRRPIIAEEICFVGNGNDLEMFPNKLKVDGPMIIRLLVNKPNSIQAVLLRIVAYFPYLADFVTLLSGVGPQAFEFQNGKRWKRRHPLSQRWLKRDISRWASRSSTFSLRSWR